MENEIPEIFKSSLVNIGWDAFWEELPEAMQSLEPKDTLVLSLPYESGSPEEIQLIKMLSACKLSAENYNIIQLLPQQKIAWHQLREVVHPNNILLLGILPEQLGVTALFVPHEINNFDQATWTATFSLTQLLSNTALKQHLWTNVFQKLYLK